MTLANCLNVVTHWGPHDEMILSNILENVHQIEFKVQWPPSIYNESTFTEPSKVLSQNLSFRNTRARCCHAIHSCLGWSFCWPGSGWCPWWLPHATQMKGWVFILIDTSDLDLIICDNWQRRECASWDSCVCKAGKCICRNEPFGGWSTSHVTRERWTVTLVDCERVIWLDH